ncbi:NAD-dependent epimerase/dehydratase family protein [Ohtaekwangia sp.]|uniref:NAD-dependent epimerase/dehydratase family protein n=1 Tax=Ohtaekwangia sp. TaxID=2066019 RepID=UPI002F91FDFF
MSGRVLITGASGFVGYHLIEAALQQGLEVFAAVRSSSKIDHLKNLPIQFTTLDFSSIPLLKAELQEKQYDYIIHAAGTIKASNFAEYVKVNADYTRNLALAAGEANIPLKKFVFISSLAAWGPSRTGLPVNEKDEATPLTSYGKSKLVAESYLAALTELPLITLRPTAVYGPREKDIFIMINSINKGFEPYIGRIPQTLSFIYVKDLAAVTVQALTSPVNNRSYFVADGHGYDRYALAAIVKKILNKNTFRIHLPLTVVKAIALFQEGIGAISGNSPILNREKLSELTATDWSCNIDQLKNDIGFSPRYTLENGMAETLQWYKENKWL